MNDDEKRTQNSYGKNSKWFFTDWVLSQNAQQL